MVGLGFVGAGNHGRHHIREFARLPGAHLVAVQVMDGDRATQAVRDFAPAASVASLDAVLSNPTIDAVIIAAPAETHRDPALAGIGTGKHVLLEKPMAHTPGDALAITEMAEKHPRLVLLVGHCERFNRALRVAHAAHTSLTLHEGKAIPL